MGLGEFAQGAGEQRLVEVIAQGCKQLLGGDGIALGERGQDSILFLSPLQRVRDDLVSTVGAADESASTLGVSDDLFGTLHAGGHSGLVAGGDGVEPVNQVSQGVAVRF